MYDKRISEILVEVGDAGSTEGILTDKDGDIFLECLTTAWWECKLRDRETRMLENTYGE
jgi:hypothetical protein